MRAFTFLAFLISAAICSAGDGSVAKLTHLLLSNDLLESQWREDWRVNIKIMILAGMLTESPKVTYADYAKRSRLTAEVCRKGVSDVIEREFTKAERLRLIAILDTPEGRRLLDVIWNAEKLKSADGVTLGEKMMDFSNKKRLEMKRFIEGRL